jgi:hypothetical protein
MKRFLLTVGLVLLLVPAARAQGKGQPVKVPFDLLKTQHMTVQVKVNGQGPYRLIFDTGAPYTLFSRQMAIDTEVVPKGQKPALPLFPGQGQYKVKSFEIGNLKDEKMTAAVMDHPLIKEISKVLGPVDGIVGLSFFARYNLTIDYQKKEMTFTPNGFEPTDVISNMMKALGGDKKAPPPVLAPAGQWGFRVARGDKDEEAGVDVKEVLAGSAAAAAGLRAGDRLLTLDGRWTDSVADCYFAASHVRPGSRAVLVVRRGGKEVELTVTVGAGL